jgi:aspartokinase-like uncharacterized kinase
MMELDAVLKVGGSLSRAAGLESLCREISRLGARHRLLVVPGGGAFADQVRETYRRYKLDETAAHCMALLAMDQYGYLLSRLITDSLLTADLPCACRAAESGRSAILLPSALVIQTDPLPHSWQVTSDTIAAWVTHQAHCRRLVLLKDVDGLLAGGYANNSQSELIAELSAEQLAEHSGGVDPYLCRFLASASLEIWVINGMQPERLSELLDAAHTTGTHILPATRQKRRRFSRIT